MATCQKIRAKRRKICIADLDRLITLQNRAIKPPTKGVDYTLEFEAADAVSGDENAFDEGFTNGFAGGFQDGQVFAMIESVSGEEYFDEHNTATNVTHNIYIRFNEDVTAETWILYEGVRFDILDVEDLDFRHEWQKLRCNNRGVASRSNNAA